MPLSRRRRGILAAAGSVAIAATALSVVAVNAYADEPFVDLSVAVPSAVTSADTQSKDVRVEVYNYGNATATGVSLTFALPETADAGAVYVRDDFAASCELNESQTAGTCSLPDVKPGAIVNLRPFTIVPADLGEDDERRIGKATVSVSSAQADLDEDDNNATFVARVGTKSSVDLVVWPTADVAVRPGASSVIDSSVFTISNESNVPAQGVEFVVIMPPEVEFTEAPDGCRLNGSLANPQENPSFQIECFWPDVVIGPGEEWAPSDERVLPFVMSADAAPGVKLDANAIIFAWEYSRDGESDDTVAIESSRSEVAAKDLQAASTSEPSAVAQDNLAELSVYTSETFADLVVTAEDVEGTVGSTVSTVVTVRNDGPADALGGFGLAVAFPEHTRVVTAPAECLPVDDTDTTFFCASVDDLNSGGDVTTTFEVELLAAPDEQLPAIAGVYATDAPDPDLENNSVEFAVTALEDDGSPSPDPSDPSTDPGTDPSEPTPAPTSADPDPDLPITGTSLTFMLAGALALILLGLVMLIAARKRRSEV